VDLILSHGRNSPDEEMDDWGFEGPTLRGVHVVQQRYRSTTTVSFISKEASESARLLTRWSVWEDDVLEVSWQDDLIETIEPDGCHRYYADMILLHPKAQDEIRQIEECLSDARYRLECATRDLDRRASVANDRSSVSLG